MIKQALTRWTGNMAFTASTGSGHDIPLDAAPEVGGNGGGPRPKELLLVALGGCTGMDVVSVLNKMRAPYDRFEVHTEAGESDTHPRVLTDIRVVYRLWGPQPTLEKLLRAVDLSWTKYCGVTNMLNKATQVTYTVEFNGAEVFAPQAPAPAAVTPG